MWLNLSLKDVEFKMKIEDYFQITENYIQMVIGLESLVGLKWAML